MHVHPIFCMLNKQPRKGAGDLGPLTPVSTPQTIKAKYKGSEYPYLLPKSPHVPPRLPFLVPGAQVADVQVRERGQAGGWEGAGFGGF